MNPASSNFLDKVLTRIGRLDEQGLQTVVKRLERERRFLETLFNTIEDGILVVDEQGRILYFNQAVTHLLGLQPEATGQSVERFVPELDWPHILQMDRRGGAGVARHEFEVSYPRRRFLSLYVAPLDGATAGSSGVALIVHDATEARQKTFAAIETERLQALTLLAASVAHEIGNPLNALHIHLQLIERELKKLRALSVPKRLVSARLLRQKPVSPEAGEQVGELAGKIERYVGVAKNEVSRLDYIVTQFLQAIRPRKPQLALTSLNQVVRGTLALLGPEIENRGVTVEQELARQLPLAPLDAVQIQQMLVNLIKNALQAMTKGGVLTLETDAGPDDVWVAVGDTGGGIPPEQISRIFEPFYTTKKKGTGLGLMIVQRVVRDHGGRIEVESHPRRGSTFRVRLPLQERQPRLLEAGRAEADGRNG